MAEPTKIIPVRCNLNLAAEAIDLQTARFMKGLSPYVGATDAYEGIKEGQNELKLKPNQSNELYVNIPIPAGDNFCVGAKGSPETNEVYVLVWNSNKKHFIYRLNCGDRTFNIVKIDPCFNFQKKPKYFMGVSQITLTLITLVQPDTNKEVIVKELKWTDGFNYQGFLRVDDSIATGGFDPLMFPYFSGNYNKCPVVRMGLPTPKGCIKVTGVPRITDPTDPNYDVPLENKMLFQKWFFILKRVDVWGRPSEWGGRSEEYTAGVNDCIANSNNIPRCVDLEFDAGDPFDNNIEIGYLNCNGTATVWHKAETLFLYKGSNIGEWWKRERNPNINYNSTTNKITYRFCANKECEIIPPDETARLENPLPKRSQAIINLNQNTALLNNKSKFNPFSQELREKILSQVISPVQRDLGLRTITIYVPIWNQNYQKWQQVVKDGTNGYTFGGVLVPTLAGGIGGVGGVGGITASSLLARNFSQYFKNIQQSGFEGYLVGAGSTISTQVYVDANGNLVDDPLFQGLFLSPIHLVFAKFVFNNVPGRASDYIFRLASHLSDANSDSNYQQTSTTVWGSVPFNRNNFQINMSENQRSRSQELLINVCNGDYNTLDQNEILVILDMAAGGNKAISGYVYTTKKNGFNERPIELANVTDVHGEAISNITDHNGFYYYSTKGSGRTFTINIRDTCITRQINNGQNGNVGMQFTNFIVDTIFSDYETAVCNQILIKGKLLLQGTNIGVSNVVVALTRGQSAITDDNGEFSIIAHDDVYSGVRNDSLIICGGGCGYTGENGMCIALISVVIQPCTTCAERIIDVGTTILQYLSQKSLLSGGTYGIGCVGWDWLGRATYVQQLGHITIPTINQVKTIGASQVKITIDPSAVFPAEIEYITFFITPETTIEKYLDWIVDDVKFIDSQGLVNNTAPTQIKIFYGSIIQYSKVRNFNTTTAWQFIPINKETPATNDRVQFFLNGDGKFFDKAISGLVKYDVSGEFFTIDYVSSLKDLKKNALIRLERPKDRTGDELYYEICGSKVEIVNQKAQINEFILNAFDTYYLNRQIPVPVPQTTPTTTSVTTTVTTGDTAIATQQTPLPTPTILELRIFGFPFEHFAPSNLWGAGCTNIGRVNSKNPYEAELIKLYNIAISGALSVNGQLNYLCYFDDRKMTDFEVPNEGGITGAFAEIGRLFLIGQSGSFIVGFNDNLGRVNTNGTFQAPSIPNEFGKPDRKPGENFGCALADKLSMQTRNGKIMWVDRNRAEAVQFDWSEIKTLTKDKCDAWFTSKVKDMIADENKYFSGSINPSTNEYLITNNSIGESDEGTTYINNERTYNGSLPETVSFDIKTRDLIQWFGFTPEAFAFLDGDVLNVQMFTFKQGLAYSHYNGNKNDSYNVFYGVETEKVLRLIYNTDAFAKKMMLVVTMYCANQKFFSDKIFTEAKQESRLLLAYWEKAAYFSYASFLCDLNTIPDPNLPAETGINKLTDGDKLYGCWIDMRLVGDPAVNSKYCEILGITVQAFKYEKS